MTSEAPKGSQTCSSEIEGLTASGVWKGENESDVELMENYDDNPLSYVGICVCVLKVCVYKCGLACIRIVGCLMVTG